MTFRVTILAIALTCTFPAVAQQPGAQPKPVLGGGPRVSRDGSRILFTSDRSGTSQLYSMKADGSDVRQLTRDPGGAYSPNWSPDGRQIVYVTPGSSSDQIVVLSTDGGSRRVVSDAKGNQTPSWFPDGPKILFAAGEFPNINIYTINANGKDRQNISPNPRFDYDPVWSPDGKMIAFVSAIRGLGPKVFVMNADGSGRHRITISVFAEERPDWSRDGQQIAFQAATRGSTPREAYIHVVDMRTGLDRQIGTHAGFQFDETPSWFPDRKRLAIQSDGDGTWSVYVIGLDGATLARLTSAR